MKKALATTRSWRKRGMLQSGCSLIGRVGTKWNVDGPLMCIHSVLTGVVCVLATQVCVVYEYGHAFLWRTIEECNNTHTHTHYKILHSFLWICIESVGLSLDVGMLTTLAPCSLLSCGTGCKFQCSHSCVVLYENLCVGVPIPLMRWITHCTHAVSCNKHCMYLYVNLHMYV